MSLQFLKLKAGSRGSAINLYLKLNRFISNIIERLLYDILEK